jgi:hypothetical protein
MLFRVGYTALLTKSQRMVWDVYLPRAEELGYIYISLKRKVEKEVKKAQLFGWIILIHSLS